MVTRQQLSHSDRQIVIQSCGRVCFDDDTLRMWDLYWATSAKDEVDDAICNTPMPSGRRLYLRRKP